MTNNSVGAAVDQDYLLSQQYRDSRKLEARANLHRRYGRQDGPNWFAWIAKHAGIPQGARILDIGCGPGWLWDEGKSVFPPGLELTLADLSPAMVEDAVQRARAAGHYAEVDGYVVDASALPFADASFDAVLACHMLYHVQDARLALQELRRVLRPGGVIAITTNAEGNMEPFYALAAAAFGSKASDPAADIFGLGRASGLMMELFDAVTTHENPSVLRVTDVDDLVLALTSFPPGDDADEASVSRLRTLVVAEMETGDGAIVIPKTQGMVRGFKPA